MFKIWSLVTILAILPMISAADEVTEIYHQRAKMFVASKPIITQKANEKDLVEMWSRIAGLKNLIDLYHLEPQLFKAKGKDALHKKMILDRVNSHLLNLKIMYKNDMAGALRDLIQLHAQFAREYMAGKVKKHQYNYAAHAAMSAGEGIAKALTEKK